MLVDVFSKGITGKVAEAALGKAGITVNKNAIPFDQNPPMVASGIRVGTPAVTTRGMREAEMDIIGELIARGAARPRTTIGRSAMIRTEVETLCRKFPLYPEAGLSRATLSQLADVFAPDGALARAIPGFEPAPARSRWPPPSPARFEEGGVLLAEAGTGTGKTLAYLVPAILSRQRVLVSTGTKNLQEQIYFKDIPALRDALGVPFTATCMKGRANYLCLHRLDQLDPTGGTARRRPSVRLRAPDAAVNVFLPIIREWSARTETGDRAELADLPEDLPFWNEVSATAETCLGTECPRYDDCFVTRMRQRAAASDVVIVNHHLLCADAAVRQSAFGEVIPACANAIVDEAHQLEDVATQYFGYQRQQLPARGSGARRRTPGGDRRRSPTNAAIDDRQGGRRSAR